MKSFLQIIFLELRAFLRSHALWVLSAISILWMFLSPRVIISDGTADGAFHVYIRYALGGVFALVAICLAVTAASSIAREREAKRLQLTLVRPVKYSIIIFGRLVALTLIGAFVLALSCFATFFYVDARKECWHVLSPIMQSPREEALQMYDAFMADSETAMEVKRTKKEIVIRLLTQKAMDHYQNITSGETVNWSFPAVPNDATKNAVRLRFTNLFDTREFIHGVFSTCDARGAISNITQSVVIVPLEKNESKNEIAKNEVTLSFENKGENNLMLRPRRDINLLYSTQNAFFANNLLFSFIQMISLLSVIIASALFLSASLGRSVAVFTILTMLFLGVASPAVIEQYPDQLETNVKDRIGLYLTRAVRDIASPINSSNPIPSLAENTCIETRALINSTVINLFLLPFLFSIASGFILSRGKLQA